MTKVEELRAIAINVMRNIDVPSYPELVDSLIAAAKEEERELIKSKAYNPYNPPDHDIGPMIYIPCWVLDNTPEPTGPVKRGELKICLNEEDFPLSLAPKEEKELTKEEYDNLFRGTFSGADTPKEISK